MPKRTLSYRDSLLEDLKDPIEASHYLNAALEEDSPESFLVALRHVSEARQMAKVAEAAGVSRESLYRMLAEKGNPTYSSLSGILGAMGLALQITPAHHGEFGGNGPEGMNVELPTTYEQRDSTNLPTLIENMNAMRGGLAAQTHDQQNAPRKPPVSIDSYQRSRDSGVGANSSEQFYGAAAMTMGANR